MTLKIDNINYSKSGKRINYNYKYEKNISKYFNPKDPFFCEYDFDVRKVPESLAIIPFLANVAPIAWFGGFDIELNELDESFFESLDLVKKQFIIDFPYIDFSKSKLYVNRLIRNSYNVTKSSMLFSGGVDAYATYFRVHKEEPDLITILGADIGVEDYKQWNRLVSLNEDEYLLRNNNKIYIKSNLRSFYTYNVDLLLPSLGWWGIIQHGLALNSLVAPVSFMKGYKKNYIASSYTDAVNIIWGSTPTIDNSIKWGKTFIEHDGYELKRQDKIDLIVKKVKSLDHSINLRVCYSLLNRSVNCSKCEKCYRSIIGIILANDNPNCYGFDVSNDIYDKVLDMFKNGFSSKGSQYFWWEILKKIDNEDLYYVFEDYDVESLKLMELRSLIKKNIDNGIRKKSNLSTLKFKIQNSFPKLFKLYLKIRQNNL